MSHGFMHPHQPSPELSEVIGNAPRPRTQVVKDIWKYIKLNDLQDKSDRRRINADALLRPVFGSDQVTMFQLSKVLKAHLTPVAA